MKGSHSNFRWYFKESRFSWHSYKRKRLHSFDQYRNFNFSIDDQIRSFCYVDTSVIVIVLLLFWHRTSPKESLHPTNSRRRSTLDLLLIQSSTYWSLCSNPQSTIRSTLIRGVDQQVHRVRDLMETYVIFTPLLNHPCTVPLDKKFCFQSYIVVLVFGFGNLMWWWPVVIFFDDKSFTTTSQLVTLQCRLFQIWLFNNFTRTDIESFALTPLFSFLLTRRWVVRTVYSYVFRGETEHWLLVTGSVKFLPDRTFRLWRSGHYTEGWVLWYFCKGSSSLGPEEFKTRHRGSSNVWVTKVTKNFKNGKIGILFSQDPKWPHLLSNSTTVQWFY